MTTLTDFTRFLIDQSFKHIVRLDRTKIRLPSFKATFYRETSRHDGWAIKIECNYNYLFILNQKVASRDVVDYTDQAEFIVGLGHLGMSINNTSPNVRKLSVSDLVALDPKLSHEATVAQKAEVLPSILQPPPSNEPPLKFKALGLHEAKAQQVKMKSFDELSKLAANQKVLMVPAPKFTRAIMISLNSLLAEGIIDTVFIKGIDDITFKAVLEEDLKEMCLNGREWFAANEGIQIV